MHSCKDMYTRGRVFKLNKLSVARCLPAGRQVRKQPLLRRLLLNKQLLLVLLDFLATRNSHLATISKLLLDLRHAFRTSYLVLRT
jgi:hypothetical protein